jgi:predicted transcriptional regulator
MAKQAGSPRTADARIRTGIRRVAVEAKQQILKAIEELPDDAGVEEALDRLYLLYKVERGLRQADRGELFSQEEVRRRMAKWLK